MTSNYNNLQKYLRQTQFHVKCAYELQVSWGHPSPLPNSMLWLKSEYQLPPARCSYFNILVKTESDALMLYKVGNIYKV